MENKIQQNIPPIQSQPLTPITSSSNLIKIILLTIFGLIILFGLVFVGIQIGKDQTTNQQPTIQLTTVFPTTTESLVPTNYISPVTQILTNDWVKFMHPVVGYLLSYPPNWKGGLQEIPQGSKQDYQDFNIQSPDYKFSTEGYPTLEQGSEVFVRAEKTDKSSIDDIYNGDLSAEIGKNKIYTTVDNQQAIQFYFIY